MSKGMHNEDCIANETLRDDILINFYIENYSRVIELNFYDSKYELSGNWLIACKVV